MFTYRKLTSRLASFIVILNLLLISMMPALPVQAGALDSPLKASGDFLWAKGMGGATLDNGIAIAVDSSGNIYGTGFFEGTVDFDPGPGIFNLTSAGGDDVYVCKFDSSGNLIWAKSLGGTSAEAGLGIAVDSSGNVYTTGYFQVIADFDPGAGVFNLTPMGGLDVFISKLDKNGNFVWAKSMGGSDSDFGISIAVDSSDNIYATGDFQLTTDFDPGVSTSNLTSAGGFDIYVSKLDSSGNFVWAKSMGGTSDDFVGDITIDLSNNVYTTGSFKLTVDFDPGADAFNLTSAGDSDIFVSKLDSSGNFVWAKSIGGIDLDFSSGIIVDASGNVYTTGNFFNTVDFDPDAGTSNLTAAGPADIFVCKLDNSGNFVWAKNMGGTSDDYGSDIALDSSGNIYTTGFYFGTADFDPGVSTFNLTSAGSFDIFVSKLDSSGNFVWAKSMGGTDNDQGNGIALDSKGNIYTTGLFSGTADFDSGAGISNLTSAGEEDIFISKLGATPLIQVVADAGGPYTTYEGSLITLDASLSSNPDGGALTYEWDLNADGEYNDAVGVTTQASFPDDGQYPVSVRVTDPSGAQDVASAQVTVLNVAPTIVEPMNLPNTPMLIGATVNASATFADPGLLDTHTALWDWGDSTNSSGVVNGYGVSGNHVYTKPGLYMVTLSVSDDDGGSDSATYKYVVEYDPKAGFVTGGGWFQSPVGAYVSKPTQKGKAEFELAAKYQKDGQRLNCKFDFELSQLEFEGKSCEWLVVAGKTVYLKGLGRMDDRRGDYYFMVSAMDGRPDMIRIKIWDKVTGQVIYDNQPGASDDALPSTAIGGGSIVIHKEK